MRARREEDHGDVAILKYCLRRLCTRAAVSESDVAEDKIGGSTFRQSNSFGTRPRHARNTKAQLLHDTPQILGDNCFILNEENTRLRSHACPRPHVFEVQLKHASARFPISYMFGD
jgi:hypothetical protein